MDAVTLALIKSMAGNGGGGGGERTVIPVTFEWSVETQKYLNPYVPADVNTHPEKYDLLCTFSGGGKYENTTTMFRYGTNLFNIPAYFGIMDIEAPSNFMVSVPSPDPGDEYTDVNFVGRIITPGKFIVTLTPTSPDFSGTMDNTVAEINAAYEAGQEIWFKVLTSATSYVEVPVSFLGKDTSFDYPNFGAEIVQSAANLMIVAQTLDTSDGTKATYSTKVYAITPAS